MKSIQIRIIVIAMISGLICSCNSLKTAVFDQYSYQQTISIKVESGNLMSKATQVYDGHETEVEELLLELQKIVEYEKNKPNNEITYAMWNILVSKDKNLLAGFFKRWKKENQLSTAFTVEAKSQVMEALDLIIKYEAQKNKTNEASILKFLTAN